MDFFTNYPALLQDLEIITQGWILPHRYAIGKASSTTGTFYFYVTPTIKKNFCYFLDDYDKIVSFIKNKYIENKNKESVSDFKYRKNYKRFW